MLDSANSELVARVVERLRALADASRVRILAHLQAGPANVTALTTALRLNQASVSKHLAVLRQAGLVAADRVGTHAVYRIADPGVMELCDRVCEGVRDHLQRQQQMLEAAMPEAKRATHRRTRPPNID
ncbi:MAG: helix-turn-helix transcriptional regulator [Phycisphaerales bacterium]|nr:helix-turn-helix transcriptional regulator [Phycisphaerales bacterium]